jgi:hypothetical protein
MSLLSTVYAADPKNYVSLNPTSFFFIYCGYTFAFYLNTLQEFPHVDLLRLLAERYGKFRQMGAIIDQSLEN